jgi:hypothetical protein
VKILPPVPDRVISTGNNLTPPWEAWFRQLYIYLTEPVSGGGAGIVTSVTNENVSQLLAMSDIEEPEPAMPMFGSFQAGAAGLNLQVQYNSGGFLAGSANFTFDGTTATVNALTVTNAVTLTAGTANQVQYLNGSKVLTGSANLTFNGTTLTAAGFAGPFNGTVGAGTPNTGAFTTLSASSTISGTGFSAYLASPPSIGSTAAGSGAFTTLSASSTFTLSGGTANGVAYLNGSKVFTTGTALAFDGTNLTLGTGNVVQGTSAKGYNFTANTAASGMTSQLFNWYEEGAWTPTYTSWTTAPTTISAQYTRIGRQVTVTLYATNGINNYNAIGGLPFTANSTQGSAGVINGSSSYTTPYGCSVLPSGTSIQGFNAVLTSIYWQLTITYFV